MGCKTCQRYDAMGYASACPCIHVNGACMTETPARLANARAARQAAELKLSRQHEAIARTEAEIELWTEQLAKLEKDLLKLPQGR